MPQNCYGRRASTSVKSFSGLRCLALVLCSVIALATIALSIHWLFGCVLAPENSSTDLCQAEANFISGIISGALILLAACLAFDASITSRNTTKEAAEATHARELMIARHDRYTAITEQLSNRNATIRLAGVYALAALADEWQTDKLDSTEEGEEEFDQRDVAVKLLCAYMRTERHAGGSGGSSSEELHEIRTAIVFLIRNHTRRDARVKWPAHLIDLRGANLWGADLSEANLEDADLRWADLQRANLEGATLSGARLGKARLCGAKLDTEQRMYAAQEGADFEEFIDLAAG